MDDGLTGFAGLPKLVSHQDLIELRTLIQQTQVDLLSSIDVLKARIGMLEKELRESNTSIKEEPIHNVFDVVSREELGIEEHKEPEIDYENEDIRIIESGFEAPPPEDNLPEGAEKWSNNIIDEIVDKGGSLSLYWKRRGYLPEDVTESQKVEVKKQLESKGINVYKVNTFRHFYYIGTEEEGEEKYDAYSQ
jgi:hypothetical protein